MAKSRRVAAVDFGLKRIGLAISDERKMIALPLGVIEAGKDFQISAKRVCEALASYSLETLIVGIPLMMNGTKGEMAQLAEKFAQALETESHIAVERMDERLSSKQAERALQGLNYSRKERSRKVDETAATLLLQAYLEKLTPF